MQVQITDTDSTEYADSIELTVGTTGAQRRTNREETDMQEARITINGQALNDAESMTVKGWGSAPS